jgi:hypothetical protein
MCVRDMVKNIIKVVDSTILLIAVYTSFGEVILSGLVSFPNE